MPPPDGGAIAAFAPRPKEQFRIKILLNDYCGHPFQVELSRELARRGHEVLHVYSADDLTPKGDLLQGPGEPAGFAIEGLSIGERLDKYKSLSKRRRQERAYGALICRRIDAYQPDLVIGSNNPLEAQNQIGNHCRRRSIPFVFWLQDIHSDAIRSYLGRRSVAAGALVGTWYEWIERRLLQNADHIVAIADAFLPRLERWRIPRAKRSVIENWAPKNKIQMLPSDNAWRRSQGLGGKRVALYTGTIGLKHNPALLLAAAEALRDEPDVQVVVVSEGKYAAQLKEEGARQRLSNLTVLPFQPFESYSQVLASGDVLMAMIENDAASYSVPSKVLSYLCSGRPIVLAASEHNLAAQTIQRARAGIVVQPQQASHYVEAIRSLLRDPLARSDAGAHARAYAEKHFDIARIADRFENILQLACARS